MTPEAKARENIDRMLSEASYVLQDMKDFNWTVSLGAAVREYPTNSDPVAYLLFVVGKPVSVVEAKVEDKGFSLTEVAEQSKRYAESGLKHLAEVPHIRFSYETTELKTNFCDYVDAKTRSREAFSFHRPETLVEWLKDDDTLRNSQLSEIYHKFTNANGD
jgi:type I restriction enzyme R subunit